MPQIMHIKRGMRGVCSDSWCYHAVKMPRFRGGAMAETCPTKPLKPLNQLNHRGEGAPRTFCIGQEPVPRYDSVLAQLIVSDPSNPAYPAYPLTVFSTVQGSLSCLSFTLLEGLRTSR